MSLERQVESMNKIKAAEVCQETRRAASQAFLMAINQVWGTPFSERQLKDLWLQELRKSGCLIDSGWYSPPPDGIGTLIGNENNPERLNYDSLRPERNWPKDNLVFDPETGLAYVYASPVDKATGVIGDWGMTFYGGVNPGIIAHLQKIYAINHLIAEKMKAEMRVSDVYNQACDIFENLGLTNNITSVTDPAGINIGHSIPGALKPFLAGELAIIRGENWERACKVISERRVFFNGKKEYIFKEGDCFTLEPRLTDLKSPHLPMVSFHTIVMITERSAELLENFEPIFHAVGMDYMR